jgi:hypothetical protein
MHVHAKKLHVHAQERDACASELVCSQERDACACEEARARKRLENSLCGVGAFCARRRVVHKRGERMYRQMSCHTACAGVCLCVSACVLLHGDLRHVAMFTGAGCQGELHAHALQWNSSRVQDRR